MVEKQPFAREELVEVMNRFVKVANEMKDKGHRPELVNASLMAASGVYSTYLMAGNQGYLEKSGVTKVAKTYENILKQVQGWKKADQKASKQTGTAT